MKRQTSCENCGWSGVLVALVPCPECGAPRFRPRFSDRYIDDLVRKTGGKPSIVALRGPSIPKVPAAEQANLRRSELHRERLHRAQELRARGHTVVEIARELKVSERYAYRLLEKARQEQQG